MGLIQASTLMAPEWEMYEGNGYLTIQKQGWKKSVCLPYANFRAWILA
jgi:hypothetical protein